MSLTEGNNDQRIEDLFTGNTSYFTVPRYQRKYVWKEINWKQLYEDIEYSVENENWSHFIGTLVFQKIDISPQNTEYIIIDGQQRIITLQLLFMAIIAVLQRIKGGGDEEENEVDRYIDIVTDLIKRKPPKGYGVERVDIDYDSSYKKISDTIITRQSIDDILQQKNPTLICQCFKYYYLLLKEKSFSQIIEYYEKLIITKLVAFNSYSEEYAYNIFETLNARGTQLKQMELMKNYLFHYLLPKDNIDIYKRKWLEVENLLFENNLDCDDFLYHLYKCKYKQHKIKVENLYDQIKQILNKEADNIAALFEDIIECVPVYISVVKCQDDDDEIAFLLQYYKVKGNKQFRSALMALLYKYKTHIVNKGVFLSLMTNLRNFLIIYNIRGITANRIDNDVHDLANSLFNSNCERDVIYSIYNFLLKDRSYFNYDDIPTIIQGLRYSNHKRYTMATSGFYIYLFELIYKNEYADYKYIGDYKGWTIEHIINDCEDVEYVSFIGNLLPVTRKFNETCGSKLYMEKRKLYLESGFSWIKDYGENQDTEPNKEDTESRTREIAKKLEKLILFDIAEMKTYNEQTEKVLLFLSMLRKEEKKYKLYIDDFKYDKYKQIESKLQNKYNDQELLSILAAL